MAPEAVGLSEAEAARRLPDRPPPAPTGTGRSYGSIVRANVLTIFNLILGVFGAVTLIYGDWRDALFLGILVANTSIGIVQAGAHGPSSRGAGAELLTECRSRR